jgi:hypothetical protein
MALAASYLDNPAEIECPRCGEGGVEVLGYLDADQLAEGRYVFADPVEEYAVVLFCHECRQGAALTFRKTGMGTV